MAKRLKISLIMFCWFVQSFSSDEKSMFRAYFLLFFPY